MDEDTLDPKEIEENDLDSDIDDILTYGKKKTKRVPDDDLLADDSEPLSLDDMAEAELGEENEPYDDVDKW